MLVSKTKAESLFNRILLLINRVKGYLNEVGRKLSIPLIKPLLRVKGYLNEVGRKPKVYSLSRTNWGKGYLNEAGRKPRTS